MRPGSNTRVGQTIVRHIKRERFIYIYISFWFVSRFENDMDMGFGYGICIGVDPGICDGVCMYVSGIRLDNEINDFSFLSV